jgi:chromosome segregation ATPase
MHFNGPSGPQEHVVQRLQEEDRDVEQRERDKREREFLEEQIKAHAQTVDILVSEKSSLQKEMSSLASKLNESQEAYASSQLYLQSARNRQTELEREKDSLEDKAASVEKELRHLMVQNSQLLSEAALLRSTADDVEQQKEELISKLRLQQAEYQQVQQRCSQLEVQLMQKGVMDSTNTEGWSLDDLKKWKEECDKLNDAVQRMRVEREDLLKQVSALKDQQNREKQDLEASLVQVQSESRAKERRIEELESLLSRAKDEQVSSAESMSLDHSLMLENVQGRLKEAEDEKAHYSQQLQEQMSTNLVLNQTISEQQSQIESLEERISRLSSDTVDQKTLLDTIQQDKEALSRSVLQNKELKAQLSELEGEFIKMVSVVVVCVIMFVYR